MRGEYFLYDNVFLQAKDFNEQKEEAIVVYEVLRLINGFPLFFDDHYSRLINSCDLIELNVKIDIGELLQKIINLGQKNNITDGNVMLKFIFDRDEHKELIYFIPHFYPLEGDYKNGVKVGFIHAERNNPEAKVEQGIKQKANQILLDSDLYEVFLVDHNGYVTEGSRSNFFLIKDNKLCTSPLNRVLKGITLMKVLDIARHYKIEVCFKQIPLEKMDNFDTLFITGTSPKILPVSKAGSFTYFVNNPLMHRLMKHYNEMITADIEKYSDM